MTSSLPHITGMRTLVCVAALTIAGCGDSSPSGGSGFDQLLNDGASCAELFDIRNEQDPKAPIVEDMNRKLRDIGCYSSTSQRTD